MKVFYLTTLALNLALILSGCGPAHVWDTYRGGPARAGSLAPRAVGITGTEVWRTELPAESFSAPTVVGDYVVVGTNDNFLNVVDAATGELLWRYRTAGDVVSDAAVADGTAYFASMDNYVYALDVSAKRLRWKLECAGRPASAPVFASGHLYVSTLAGTVHAARADDGRQYFYLRGYSPIWAPPSISEDDIYFADRYGFVYRLAGKKGTTVWETDVGVEIVAQVILIELISVAASVEREIVA